MRVTRLSLRNFRVFPELDLEMPPGVVGHLRAQRRRQVDAGGVDPVGALRRGPHRQGGAAVRRRRRRDGRHRGVRARRAPLRGDAHAVGRGQRRQGGSGLRRAAGGGGRRGRAAVRAPGAGHERRGLPLVGVLRAEAARRLLRPPARGASQAGARPARHHAARPGPRHGPVARPAPRSSRSRRRGSCSAMSKPWPPRRPSSTGGSSPREAARVAAEAALATASESRGRRRGRRRRGGAAQAGA